MSIQITSQFANRLAIFRNRNFFGLDGKTTAIIYGFAYSPVNPGGRFSEFRQDVEDAVVTN
jgi:hypothetical protein